MSVSNEQYQKAESLQNLLISHATGSMEDNDEYFELRRELLREKGIENLIPPFVRTNRTLGQFWGFISQKFSTYKERRQFIWDEFSPMLEALEATKASPADQLVSDVLDHFDTETVHRLWVKALERRMHDPEGAITAARTLLESVCKHILDKEAVNYPNDADLPKLYSLTSKQLNIAPSQHSENVFKQILGGCTSVIEGLGALRNRLGDSHGVGKSAPKPAPRHAELAVNIAGTMATFLVSTWEVRQSSHEEERT